MAIPMKKLLILILSLTITLPVLANESKTETLSLKQSIADSVITAKITAQYTKNPMLNPLKLSVSTNNAVVTLKGFVGNNKAYVEALKLAKSTTGVQHVRATDLFIKEVNTSFTDAYITAKVETAILKAKVFDDESIPLVGINATTSNGVVTLTGNIKKSASINPIIKRVNNIKGVKKIIAHINFPEHSDT